MIDILPVNADAVVFNFKADTPINGKGSEPNRFLALVGLQAFKAPFRLFPGRCLEPDSLLLKAF